MKLTRLAGVFVVAMGLAVMSSGCSEINSQQGRSLAEASRLVEDQPGVTAGRVELRNVKSGFASRWGVDVFFEPDAAALHGQGSSLLKNLLRIGWSVRDHRIDGGVSLVVEGASEVNMPDLARQEEIPPIVSNKNITNEITVTSRELSRAFGEWPG